MQIGFFIVSGLIPWLYVAFGFNSTIATDAAPSTSHFEIIDGSLYEIIDSDGKLFNDHDSMTKQESMEVPSLERITTTNTQRQKKVWDLISTFDSFKTSISYKNDANGKPTLENYKYIILPIWWSDYDTSDPAKTMDPARVVSPFEENQPYYIDMSWGKMTDGVTWKLLPQEMFDISSVSPDFGNTASSTRNILSQKGFREGVDYDGICLTYYTAQSGPFSGAGGWGNVNGPFYWASYPGSFGVARHEVGHNFGHPHHLSNDYEYRNTRPSMGEGTVPYDGFDMMSGGNGYDISHFPAASKWFFNWIPDSSIILMQPEGSTTECPSCSSSGTFTLRPFDDKNLSPTPGRKMAIHIPIVAEGNTLYSYWLSYRSGVDGLAAKGLSMHLSWFRLGGYFGATYDSLNFDAFGNTATRMDSFVVENTCYHLNPPAYLKDKALVPAEQIQPVVCVDSINKGSSITVSLSFLQKMNPPLPKISIEQEVKLDCKNGGSTTGTIDLDANNYNMIEVKNTGADGNVELNMCTTATGVTASAYFYDDYPHSAITYGSEAAYGSFKSLITSQTCSTTDSLLYKSDYGKVYILIPPSSGSSTVRVEATCQLSRCLTNQYLSNDMCVQCPDGYRSSEGSTSISDCIKCPGGTVLQHPLSKQCTVMDNFEEITEATGWRIWAPKFDTSAGWAWDVPELEFYDNFDCTGSPINSSEGSPIDSGNAGNGWRPRNAFDGNTGSTWGGRHDSDGLFYLGLDFGGKLKQVHCVKLYRTDKYAKSIRVQAYINGNWKNAWIENNLATNGAFSVISIDYKSIPSPPPSISESPSMKESLAPTLMPSLSNFPSITPSSVPSKTPVEYIEVDSESCETFGYTTITKKQDCIDAAIFLGRTITWGPYGGWNDVVTGCSARFSIDNTNLFFQEPGICDPTANIDGWTYTGCKCADWMPCLCRIPKTIPSHAPSPSKSSSKPSSSPISISEFPSIKQSLAPTLIPSPAPNLSKSFEPSVIPTYVPTLKPYLTPTSMPSLSKFPSITPSSVPSETPMEYIEVDSESCETFGYTTITNEQDCIDAAILLGRTITWGPYGGWNDVVTGCSARFSIDNTNLFFQEPDICDPTANIGWWAYTGCKCADWMPCLCRIPKTSIPSHAPSLSYSFEPSASPTYVPSTPPSETGYCHPEDVMGNVLFVSAAGYCFKIEVSVGGQIIGDSNDPKCDTKSGKGISFSNYAGFTEKTLNWTPENGAAVTMDFLENKSLTEPNLVIHDSQSGKFVVTLEIPSCYMTDPPSHAPTVYPSNAFCSEEDVSGYFFFASIAGYCFRIELIDGVGQLIGDDSDPNCDIKSGTGIPFSNFDGFSGNTALWSTGTAGFSGTMNFMKDPTVSGPKLINNGLNGQIFDITLVLPSCQQIP